MPDNLLQIHRLDDSGRVRWDAFVHSSPQGSFFHLSGWRTVIESAFGHACHYLYAEQAGEVVGVLPLAHIRSKLFANALISTPFCVYGGAVAASESVRVALEQAALELAGELSVEYLELREREGIERPDWSTKDLHCTFRREISDDHDTNLKAIPRKQRALVRKALRNEMVVEIDRDTGRLYDLYARSLRDLGTPVFSSKYMRVLTDVFSDDCEIMIITHQSEAVAGVLSFYFRDEVLPYYAGANEKARGLKANDFMYWQLMCRAADRGVGYFDFGRSKRDTGAFSFKKHWGFEPQPLPYMYRLIAAEALPDISPVNPRYQRFIRAWQKMPVALTRVIGPVLARNLG